MRRFKVERKLSLDFLGDDWKEAYIIFCAFSPNDVINKFPELTKLKDQESTNEGVKVLLDVLKGQFISGKGIEGGKLVDLVVDDLDDLPLEVITKAISFLSQGTTVPSPKPSGES